VRECDGGVQPPDELLIAIRARAGIAEGVVGGSQGLVVPFEQGVDQAECHGLEAGRLRVEPRDPRHQGVCPGYGGHSHSHILARVVNYLSSVSQDYADLFCELFDQLDAAQLHAEGVAWMRDAEVAATAAGVGQAALDGEHVAAPDHGHQTFAVLAGLDAALTHANPLLGGPPPPALTEYALRYAESGRFDSGALPGALLPRFARPGRRGQLPDHPVEAFGAVVRVDAAGWDACDHATLPVRSRLTRQEREAGLRVAAAPMIREPDELEWEVEERSGLRFYRIHPADREPTRARVEKVIAKWDEHDVAIGIAPELCLSRPLLERWQAALRERPGAGTSRLRLVVAGSGNVEGSSPPANVAVLLDARTGEVLVRQRKVHPFNFSREDLELWGLADRLTAPIDEDLHRGRRVCVVEAGGVRLAILVCEDLARLHAFAAALHAHGVSLLLVPVFARPTKDRRWERARAEVYSDAIGSSVVVANSLVIAEMLGSPMPVGTALAVAPGHAAVGHSSEPDDVVVFELDGDVPRVAHERVGAPD
jgi:predicted amidohydrolase